LVEQVGDGVEGDGLAVEDGGHPQRDRQMGFPDARRPQQQHILAVRDEADGGQVADLRLVDRRLAGEVELVERFDERKTRAANMGGDGLLLAGGELGLKQAVEERGITPVLGGGLLCQCIQAVGRREELQVV